jgi:hypothetical protein
MIKDMQGVFQLGQPNPSHMHSIANAQKNEFLFTIPKCHTPFPYDPIETIHNTRTLVPKKSLLNFFVVHL